MSCANVETIKAGDGSKLTFSFNFPYILESEIHVYFWNATTKEWEEKLTTDATYPWQIPEANPTTVEFTGTAPPAPAAPSFPGEGTVDNVKIRRITKVDDIRALFNPGSAIRSNDLNKNFEQFLYAVQELNCGEAPTETLDQYLRDYYWSKFDSTYYVGETWPTNASVKDRSIATIAAQEQQFDIDYSTLVQTTTPTGTYPTGKTWLQNDDDLTLSIWNGSAWTGVVSGGTFTNQPKVVYVDASSGDDSNDGHRISRPKLTIKAAVQQINNDATFGDGSVVVVAPGTYQEACPIDIEKANVSIVGTALRSCIIHPTVATETNVMFRVNSGTFLQNLTFTGVKAGTGTGNTLDSTLPTTQGWNVAFYPNCTITKSPYIQNCTNFSDSEIDNSNINVITPAGGLAGDTDSAPTGGGLLIDGSVPATTSPLRSMVCDSYTHVGLNGPGILVTNNGYAQCTSSYAFFNKYHIKCLNGGQANLAASTTDFGEKALVADGKSTTAIFTSNVDGAASSGDVSFNINEPTAGTGWFGDTQRPANNMLVEVNSVIYPILSATANTDSEGGSGWTVTISRPDPNNRSTNLGLNGAISDDAAVSFYLRSMIASSGHTMEYVGSGTDYRALPENGGVPDETAQITELNNGKVWTAVTDHNGKFKVGGNQTDDPFFEVDQQRGFVTIPEGSIAFNLLSDLTPQLGGDLDVNGNTITGLPATPTVSTEAASKAYVDAEINGISSDLVDDTTPQLGGNLDVNDREIISTGEDDIILNPDGTGTVNVSTSRITNVTDPTSDQDAATKAYVDNYTTPAGTVILSARTTAPTGYLAADGAAISRTTYADLFAAIGTTYGAGNGSTTFNIPDLRDEFIRGSSSTLAVGTTQSSQNKSHSHTATSTTTGGNHNHPASVGTGGAHSHTVLRGVSPDPEQGSSANLLETRNDFDNDTTYGTSSHNGHQHPITVNNSGNLTISTSTTITDDGGTEARPQNMALLACIKY